MQKIQNEKLMKQLQYLKHLITVDNDIYTPARSLMEDKQLMAGVIAILADIKLRDQIREVPELRELQELLALLLEPLVPKIQQLETLSVMLRKFIPEDSED